MISSPMTWTAPSASVGGGFDHPHRTAAHQGGDFTHGVGQQLVVFGVDRKVVHHLFEQTQLVKGRAVGGGGVRRRNSGRRLVSGVMVRPHGESGEPSGNGR